MFAYLFTARSDDGTSLKLSCLVFSEMSAINCNDENKATGIIAYCSLNTLRDDLSQINGKIAWLRGSKVMGKNF